MRKLQTGGGMKKTRPKSPVQKLKPEMPEPEYGKTRPYTIPKPTSRYQTGGKKKPTKYYSEIAVGKGNYSKPRTEKQQKEWEEAELRMIDPSYWSKPAPKPAPKTVVKKSRTGSSLGMKSVKAGYDKNPGVTRADFVSIGKSKAKTGTSKKKAMGGMSMTKLANMKKGGKCKYGC
jgi:hypothetical protein